MFNSIKSLNWKDRSASQSTPGGTLTRPRETPPTTLAQLVNTDTPPRPDGSDRFFGMENVVGVRSEPPFGNTCYCNAILQCLYYSKPFREHVVSYPQRGQKPYTPSASSGSVDSNNRPLIRINTDQLPTTSASARSAAKAQSAALSPGTPGEKKSKPLPAVATVQSPGAQPPENKDSPEFKKRKALENGPVLELDQGNHEAYGMEESLFTSLKDVFESIMAQNSKTGIVKPSRFLEILRSRNDMFNGQQHQDAHEFLNYVLNEVIENVEAHEKKQLANGIPRAPADPPSAASSFSAASGSVTGWMHDLFQGQLTSETKCLTCTNVSRRDEHFLDLSIDVEKNSSVTSCLRAFSASEMLCERNKFHCDTCGGLQEAEKRMKIKRLPKVLALHLKRFKYMEQTGRFEKLHYRVLYPYHLRLFNTTDDAEDPDRLYELYAVVVHIGGGPYHGHYVAIIKTEDKGWLLFDDELVEPVDKSYVRNFFGERSGPGVASAYLLFYQETTLEQVRAEMWADEIVAPAHPPTPLASPVIPTPDPEPLPKKGKDKHKKEKPDGGAGEPHGSISRFRTTSRSLRQPPKWLGGGGGAGGGKTRPKDPPPASPPLSPMTLAPPLPGFGPDPAPSPGALSTVSAIAPAAQPAKPVRRVDTLPFDWKQLGGRADTTTTTTENQTPAENAAEKEEKGGSARRRLQAHRPSLWGLRKKAQTVMGAGE